jgi:hypothetical protein
MDKARTDAYLAAVDSGDREKANALLDQMFAEIEAEYTAHSSALAKAGDALAGLFAAADEIMDNPIYQ